MELVTTTFEKTAPLSEALALVHSSDVIIGMHGAGLTNLLGMHKVSLVSCVSLFRTPFVS